MVSGVVFFRGAVAPVGVEAAAGKGGSGAGSGAVEGGFGGGRCDSGEGTEGAGYGFYLFLASLKGLMSANRGYSKGAGERRDNIMVIFQGKR